MFYIRIILSVIFINLVVISYTQVAFNADGSPPDSSAMLDLKSNNLGFLLPAMTTEEMNAISNPAEGLIIFNTTANRPVVFNGVVWTTLGGNHQCGVPFQDERDGQFYNTIGIGKQCWMADNLNIGTIIPGNTEPSYNFIIEKYCYDDQEANCDTMGGLYNWLEMLEWTVEPGKQGICPDGWHLPTDEEWCELENYVDTVEVSCEVTGYRGAVCGKRLKSTSGWYGGWNGTDQYHFKVLPAGYRTFGGNFSAKGVHSYFWSSSEETTLNGWTRLFTNIYDLVQRGNLGYTNGLSVRCLRDE